MFRPLSILAFLVTFSLTPFASAQVASASQASEFSWSENRKLTWDDFQGPIKASSERSAAATHCGIGFKTFNADGKPRVLVYNTFYSNQSWVRPDAKLPEILQHEQGHFDINEIYTRKMRARMDSFDFNVSDVKAALMAIYDEVDSEYQNVQQSYESETVHGTNTKQQKIWLDRIERDLIATRP